LKEPIEFKLEHFKKMLTITRSVPQNCQTVMEGLMTAIFCHKKGLFTFDVPACADILLTDTVAFLADHKSLTSFAFKFLLHA